MPIKFIPAKKSALTGLGEAAKMVLDCMVVEPATNMAGALKTTATPLPVAPANPISIVPKIPSITEKVDSMMAVTKTLQPTASSPGAAYSLAPSTSVQTVQTSIPIAQGLPTRVGGGLGSVNLQSLATMQSMKGLGQEAPMTSDGRFTLAPTGIASRLQMIPGGSTFRVIGGGGETPWALYAAYGAAGLALLGLGYVAFGMKPKA